MSSISGESAGTQVAHHIRDRDLLLDGSLAAREELLAIYLDRTDAILADMFDQEKLPKLPNIAQTEDARHAGYLGLLEAMEEWRPGQAQAFAAHADRHIRDAVYQSFGEQFLFPDYLGREHIKNAARIGVWLERGGDEYQSKEELIHDMDLPDVLSLRMSKDQPNEVLDFSAGEYIDFLASYLQPAILEDVPPHLDMSLPYDLPNEERFDPVPADVIRREVARAAIRWVDHRLEPRERQVITRIYGLGDESPQPSRTIGNALGISSTKVDRTQERAIAKLRNPLDDNPHPLREFVD